MFVLSNIKKLYTGLGDRPSDVLSHFDLVVKKGKVEDLRPHSKDYSEDYKVIDCGELYVSPGLIDCHSHITLVGLHQEAIDRSNSMASLLYIEKILYKTLVDGGVTTIREIGGATDFIKRMVDQGVLIGPRMKIAIAILSSTGGHIDFCGPDRCHGDVSPLFKSGPGRPSSIVDGPQECRKRVRELAACGADFVKLCTSSGVSSPNDSLEHEDLSDEEIYAIVDEANKRGLKVAAHAHTKKGIEMAIKGGVEDIQHISFLDDPLGELAHKHGCTVTPTSWVIQEFLNIKDISSFVREKLHQVSEAHGAAVKSAHQSGLPILAGSDPFLPGMHGQNYKEIAALHSEGLPALTAWYGATGLAAKKIGFDDIGALEKNRRADLLVLNENVFESPAKMNKQSLLEVFKDGLAHKGYFNELEVNDYNRSVQKFLPDESTGKLGLSLPR